MQLIWACAHTTLFFFSPDPWVQLQNIGVNCQGWQPRAGLYSKPSKSVHMNLKIGITDRMTALSSAQVWFRTGHTALGCEQTAKSTSNPVQERQVTVTAVWGWVLLWSDRFYLLGKTKILILHLRPFNLIRENFLCWNAGQALQYKVSSGNHWIFKNNEMVLKTSTCVCTYFSI